MDEPPEAPPPRVGVGDDGPVEPPQLPPGTVAASIRITPPPRRGLIAGRRASTVGAVPGAAPALGGGNPGVLEASAQVGVAAAAERALAAGASARASAAASRAGADPGQAAREPAALPVHQPPLPAARARQPVESVARAGRYPQDAGLYDAGSAPFPAPEDDNRGYLQPVEPELDADELLRLFDPSRDRIPAGTRS